MSSDGITDGVAEIVLDSWIDFIALSNKAFRTSPAYVYRGQAEWDWPIVTTIDRLEQRFPKRKNLSNGVPDFFDSPPFTEEQHLAAFRRAIRGMRGPNAIPLDENACWALGQHYGLATPLLDWTRAPFIALFFAFEEEVILREGQLVEPKYRAVFALSTSVWEEVSDVICFVSPDADDNFRLTSQAGILVRLPRRDHLESIVRKRFSGDIRSSVLTKIKIPNTDRHECLIALNKMGINHMTLFPDLTGAAKHVNSLWQPGHEDSIAYL
jgi:hypothetical protein